MKFIRVCLSFESLRAGVNKDYFPSLDFYNALNSKIEVDFESSHIANAVHLDHSNGFLFRLDS